MEFLTFEQSDRVGVLRINRPKALNALNTDLLIELRGFLEAKELILTGRHVGAEEAHRMGLVNRVLPQAELLDACLETAQKIAGNAWTAVVQAKRVIHHGDRISMAEALALERDACALCFASPDQCEGMTAFLEKRKPHFA